MRECNIYRYEEKWARGLSIMIHLLIDLRDWNSILPHTSFDEGPVLRVAPAGNPFRMFGGFTRAVGRFWTRPVEISSGTKRNMFPA